MRFNPEKTELLIFNHNVKRTAEAKREDDWRGNLVHSGSEVKMSNSIRLATQSGVMLSDDLTAKEHLNKRRTALARIDKLGFNDIKTGATIKGNMFKVYLRTITMYGVENFNLSNNEINNLI